MTTSLLGLDEGWLYLAGLMLFLITLATVETVWPLHRDAPQPRGRLLTNFGMGLLNIIMLAAPPLSVIGAAQWAHMEGLGLLNLLSVHWPVAAIATIAARSLVGYALHRLAHANRWLWRIHRVHHCDVTVDLSTGFRNHPFETLWIATCLIIAAGAIGFQPAALAAYETVAFLFALWSHANFKLPRWAERAIRPILVTPEMHHVHHSKIRSETDSNFGDVFSIWDRIFGTHVMLDGKALSEICFGLDAADASSITGQLSAPLRREQA